MAREAEADAIILLLDQQVNFKSLLKKCSKTNLVISTVSGDVFESASEAGVDSILLDRSESTVHDRLSQSVLECIAREIVVPGASVVAIYSGFDSEDIDTISVFKLKERLGRLTARDLRRLETKVPLETLKNVVDLAVEIGREGREGKPVGTMFVVGDHRKVMEQSKPAGFDFVKGYTRKERNITDNRVKEGIKEIAQMDGAFVISADGTVESSCRIIDTDPVQLTMTTGLGSRHYSGAAISKNTKAVAVVVSETNGTVRIFHDGKIVLRIEPLRRALKWKDSLDQPPTESDKSSSKDS